MTARIALVLVAGLGFAQAQTLPPRPEALTFQPLAFQAPKARDFKAQLRNGIPAFLAADPAGAPVVRLTVSWKGGSFLEPTGKEGLADLFGGQLAQGGTTTRTPAQVEEALEQTAASITSSCGDTTGSLSLVCLEKDFEASFELFLGLLQRPGFAAERLELAKGTQRQAMERRNDAVTTIAPAEMNRLLFGETHYLGRDTTASGLASITREDLLAFHARLLHPGNLMVTASGKFDRKALLARLNDSLGRLKAESGAQATPKVPAPEHARKPGIYVVDKAAPQAMVSWAFPGLRRSDPEWHAAFVMNQILGGGGFSSRLTRTIRSNEGLTYGVRTTLGEGPYFRGDLAGSSQTSNKSVAYLLRLALAEMQKLKEAPVPEADLKLIKDAIIESFPARWSGKAAVVGTFVGEAQAGWPEDWWQDYRQKIQAVTATEVQKAARRLLDSSQVVILAVGRAAEMEAGDPDHPGSLKEVLPLPAVRLPLRDPLTLQPLK